MNVTVPKSANGTRLLPDSKSCIAPLAKCSTSNPIPQHVDVLKKTYLNNPLSISLAQCSSRAFITESMRHTVSGTQVLKHSSSASSAGGVNSGFDAVARRDGEIVEVVGVVWVPFVPGFVGGLGAFDQELDAGLEDGFATESARKGKESGLQQDEMG